MSQIVLYLDLNVFFKINFTGRMLGNLKTCYCEENSEWMLLNKAAFLDPRFSRIVHLSPERRNLVYDGLSNEMKDNERENGSKEEEKAAALGVTGSRFGDLYKPSDSGKSHRGVTEEMQTYMRETPLSADCNPLLWWKDTGCTRYPQLSELACKYLCVPGTSVRSERLVSSAGNIVNKKRAALDPDQVDRLVFLANNQKK